MGEERWRKDEILAAKIKKFLSVSLHAVRVSVCRVVGYSTHLSLLLCIFPYEVYIYLALKLFTAPSRRPDILSFTKQGWENLQIKLFVQLLIKQKFIMLPGQVRGGGGWSFTLFISPSPLFIRFYFKLMWTVSVFLNDLVFK